MSATDKPTPTTAAPTFKRGRFLIWLTDRNERRAYGGGRWTFRLPWSKWASVRMMREIGMEL